MKKFSENFNSIADQILRESESIEGFLAPNEIRFLALLAAYPTADGEILEIGSFKGKSTIILAKSAADNSESIINAVDPMTAPSETDPDLHIDSSSLPDFERNIEMAGVKEKIRLHQMYSYELARTWNKPIRLLWIDGNHTYRGTKQDFDGFAKHLAEGAIIAIHDVLHEFDGGIRVFMEDILLSPDFGACGFVGSIAWAQYNGNDNKTESYRKEKLKYYKRLSKLIPYVVFNKKLKGLEKKVYKIRRSRIPHGAIDPQAWVEQVNGKRKNK